MKIVCTNTEDCGYTSTLESTKENENIYATVCPNCGSISFVYSPDAVPIYKKEYTKSDIEQTIYETINKINSETKDE